LKWFQHDGDAHRDIKLRKLYKKYGFEGLGIYWTILGMICEGMNPQNVTCELEITSDFLAEDFKISQEKIDAVLNCCTEEGLFDRGKSGNIRCIKLLERMDNTLSKNQEIIKIKREGSKFLEKVKSEKPLLESEKSLLTDEITLERIERKKEEKERLLGRKLTGAEISDLCFEFSQNQKQA